MREKLSARRGLGNDKSAQNFMGLFQIHHNLVRGDSIKGEVIVCEARSTTKPRPIKFSSNDKIQRITLKTSAYCVITKSERWTDS